MIEKHIVLEDIDPVMFYGVNNAHLQMIKSLYPKLRIVARDNVIRVLGDEEEMAKVEEDIEQMRKHLLKYNMLNDEPPTSTNFTKTGTAIAKCPLGST